MTKIAIYFLLLCGVSCLKAQSLPDAPKPVKAFALNVGVDQRYSLTKSTLETAPRFTLDYRVSHTLRFGASVSRSFIESKLPNGPPSLLFPFGTPAYYQGTTVSLGVNYKIFDWGKRE